MTSSVPSDELPGGLRRYRNLVGAALLVACILMPSALTASHSPSINRFAQLSLPHNASNLNILQEVERQAMRLQILAAPDRLKQMSAAKITQALGNPALIRREKQVAIWQYRGKGCAVDLYFRNDARALRPLYIEWRGMDKANCLTPI